MTYEEFKKRIDSGNDIDHKTAIKLIEELWIYVERVESISSLFDDQTYEDVVHESHDIIENVNEIFLDAEWKNKN